MRHLRFFIFNLLFLLLVHPAWSQRALLKEPFQPQIGDLIQNFGILGRTSAAAALQDVNFYASVERFIELSEAAYPGLTYAFVGRDVTPLALAVQAYYTAIGDASRVVLLPLSGPSVRGMNESETMEFLVQHGMPSVPNMNKRPFVFVDRTNYILPDDLGQSASQLGLLLSAVYKSFDRMGVKPEAYLRRYNAISVSALSAEQLNSPRLTSLNSPYDASQFTARQLSLYRLVDLGRTKFLSPNSLPLIQIDPRLLDQKDLEWTDSFGKVERKDRNSPLNVAAPNGDETKRSNNLIFMSSVWQHYWDRLSWRSSFGENIRPFFSGGIDAQSTRALIEWLRDRGLDAGNRWTTQVWVMDLARSAERTNENLLSLLLALPNEWSTDVLSEIKGKIYDPKWSAQKDWISLTTELAILPALAREAKANPEIQEKILDRFASTMEQWMSFEGAGGRTVSKERIQFFESLLGSSTEEKKEFLDLFVERAGRLAEKDGFKLEDFRSIEVTKKAQGAPINNQDNIKGAAAGALSMLMTSVGAFSFWFPGASGIAPMLITLGAYSGALGIKNLIYGGIFKDSLLAKRIADLKKPDTSKKSVQFLEKVGTNVTKTIRSCVLTLGKK